MAPDLSNSPYPGLRPFHEKDAAFFYGRKREIRIIAANVQSEPLTILYGASGVGKSSLLQAGVIPELKGDRCDSNAIYFREWQDSNKVADLVAEIAALSEVTGKSITSLPSTTTPCFILLDQFEEFLLYHLPDDETGKAMDAALARLINRSGPESGVLIGIREDSLSELDKRFGLRIPGLLNNTLLVQYLTVSCARTAIESPLAMLEKQHGDKYTIEPKLVDEILKAASTPRQPTNSPVPALTVEDTDPRVEPVILQLILKRLWNEEFRSGPVEASQQPPWVLHAETLRRIGGADRIVESHVEEVMRGLTQKTQLDIATRIFPHLVTPSRRKIAQSTRDLLCFSGAPEAETRAVLKHLSAGEEARILRHLVVPDMYELFHDVLAQPVLAWRRRHLAWMERRRLMWQWILYTTISVVVVTVGISAWIIYRRQAEKAQFAFAREEVQATALRAERGVVQSNAEALKAKASGDFQKYKALLAQVQHDQLAVQEAQSAASALKTPNRPQTVVDLVNQQIRLSQEISGLQVRLDTALKENEQLRQAAASTNAAAKQNASSKTAISSGTSGNKVNSVVPQTIGSIFEYEPGKTCTIITAPMRIVRHGYARVPGSGDNYLYIFARGESPINFDTFVISKSEWGKLGNQGSYSGYLPGDYLAGRGIEAKKWECPALNRDIPGESAPFQSINDKYRLNLISIDRGPQGVIRTATLNICEMEP
jgi:hypothetical protein